MQSTNTSLTTYCYFRIAILIPSCDVFFDEHNIIMSIIYINIMVITVKEKEKKESIA